MSVFVKIKMCIQLSTENCETHPGLLFFRVEAVRGEGLTASSHAGRSFSFCRQSHAEVLQAVSLPSPEYPKEDRKSALICVLILKSCLFVFLSRLESLKNTILEYWYYFAEQQLVSGLSMSDSFEQN